MSKGRIRRRGGAKSASGARPSLFFLIALLLGLILLGYMFVRAAANPEKPPKAVPAPSTQR